MKIKITILIIFISLFAQAQQIIKRDLEFNPILAKEAQSKAAFKMTAMAMGDTLSVPFLDDFSKVGVYPDPAKWLNNYVFINNSYPIAPPSIGVATFDGLNEVGYPYDFSVTQNSSSSADTLTSKPLHLSLPVTDSVYFSFKYQAMGRGNAPEAKDSLVVDFRKPNQKKWQRVWSKKGYNPGSDSLFKTVMIAIKDTAYLQEGFQFRFRNFATVSGGVDHWHIDYVYLNSLRDKSDTIVKDVTFVYDAQSMIKKYNVMPWEQYQSSDMKTSTRIFIRNNIPKGSNTSVKFRDSVMTASGSEIYSFVGGTDNIDSYYDIGYFNNTNFSTPPITGFQFPTLTDTTRFTTYYVLRPGDKNEIIENDTIKHYQVFSNYYAYDDGVPESAVQVTGQTAQNARIAFRFDLNKADTLRAVSFYFMPFLANTSLEGFQLRVWGDSSGYPGTLIYTETLTQFPVYDKSDIHKFHTYKLQTPFKVAAGTVYVGFMQVTATGLNVGMDVNQNNMDKMFVKFISNPNKWELGSTVGFTGTPMIRPIFGSDISLVGVEKNELASKPTINIYPNPANDILFVDVNNLNDQNVTINVLSIEGREIFTLNSNNSHNSINIGDLPNGIYFVKTSTGDSFGTTKLIISH